MEKIGVRIQGSRRAVVAKKKLYTYVTIKAYEIYVQYLDVRGIKTIYTLKWKFSVKM